MGTLVSLSRQLMTLLDARKSVNCHMLRHFLSQLLFGCLGNKTERVQHELEVINQSDGWSTVTSFSDSEDSISVGGKRAERGWGWCSMYIIY